MALSMLKSNLATMSDDEVIQAVDDIAEIINKAVIELHNELNNAEPSIHKGQ
jgi:hypothetical protein